MKKEKKYSVQEWLPFDMILENGIIKLKNSSFIKIIKVIPINYNLKSIFEKEAILNSYKIFLKTCDFNIQILIQSKKENLSKIISNIKNNQNKEINILSEKYINFIKELNQEKNLSSKNFYILIKYSPNTKKEPLNITNLAIQELENNYRTIKDGLNKCRK